MKKLVNRVMMQEIDRITMKEIGIQSMVLMERAALKVYERVLILLDEKKGGRKEKNDTHNAILVVCGTGNNGGDGIAAARMLFQAGIKVQIQILGTMDHASAEMRNQLEIVTRLGVPFVLEPSYNDYSIIVDSIFGIGLTHQITGQFAQVINEINQSNATIVAVDLPSGIHADDGSVMNVAVKADVTVTFGYQKLGLILYPGRDYSGKVYVEDVGFPQAAYDRMLELHPECNQPFTYDKEDLARMPKRPRHSHKGTFGTVCVVAGSRGMSGACYFAAKAALRIGAGLVKVLTVSENRSIIQTLLPEAVVLTYDEATLQDSADKEKYIAAIETADTIIIGPGLGKSKLSEEILDLTLSHTKCPTIIDADGINLLADQISQKVKESDLAESELVESDFEANIRRRMKCLNEILPEHVILTPHRKEFARLLECDICKISVKFIDTLELYSYNKMLFYVIKDAITTVVGRNKRYFNISGNDGLATGGSGDVLTGIIGGLISQGLEEYEAACLGVYVHGLTAEYYSGNSYSGSMIASDIVEQIGNVLK